MKEKNIFENAKFGDEFLTRDGRKAVLITYNQRNKQDPYVLAVQCYKDELKSICQTFLPNGQKHENIETRNDIVARYKEPLDHAELNVVIDSKCWEYENGEVTDISYRDFGLGFKEGYKYALGYGQLTPP